MKKGQPHIPINHRLSNKHWRKVEIQRTLYMLVGHSLVSRHHHWRPGNMGGPWNLKGGHSIQNSVRNIKAIDASLPKPQKWRVPGRLASHVFNQEPRKEEKPPQGRLLQLPASNSLCFTKFRRAPRQVHKGLQPLLGKGVQRAGFQQDKQTKTVRVWRRAQQISSIYLAFVQVKSAIYLDGIWHLNHSQVLWPDKIPGKRTVLALANAKA